MSPPWDQFGDLLQVEVEFGGQKVSDAWRLRTLDQENAWLKKLLTEAMLDNVVLKDLASKNGKARREAGGSRLCP